MAKGGVVMVTARDAMAASMAAAHGFESSSRWLTREEWWRQAMTDRYTPERIARLVEVLGEFEKIEDRDLEWFIGTIAIWKASRLLFRPMNVPTYRRGYVFELPEDMSFETVPFTRTGGQPAVAMLLRSPKEEFLAGWVSVAQAETANTAVSFLNSELEAAWAYHRQLLARASDDLGDAAVEKERWFVFEQGSEFAPDAPWGYQQLRISTLAASSTSIGTAAGTRSCARWWTRSAADASSGRCDPRRSPRRRRSRSCREHPCS